MPSKTLLETGSAILLETGDDLLLEGFPYDWSSSYQIQSDPSKVSGSSNLTDFPVLIKDDNLSSAVYAGLKSDAGDLRITTDSAGTTEVPFEIVSLDTSAETCEIWAKVPTLSYNSATSLFIWYGNSSALPYSATDTFGSQAVWTNQEARYHEETLTFDSTSNGYTLTNTNNVLNATGQIGQGADFGDQSGSKKSLSRTDGLGIDLTGNWTIGFWVNVNTAPVSSEQQYLIDIRSTTGTARYQLIKYRDNSGTKQVEINSGGTVTQINQTLTTSTWYYYVVNKSSTTMTVYINGSSVGTGSFGSTANAINKTVIATAIDLASNPSKVILDEIFFTTQNLSSDWIATEYNNQNDPSTFWLPPLITHELSEVITVTDTFIRGPQRILSDSISITDSIIFFTAIILSEAINMVDSIIKGSQKVLSQQITLSDLFLGEKDNQKIIVEVITITDNLLKVPNRVLSETIGVTDTLLKTAGKTLAETLTILDIFVRISEKLFSESISLVDSIIKSSSRNRFFTENITVTDTIEFIREKILLESITVTDNIVKELNGVVVSIWSRVSKASAVTWSRVSKTASVVWKRKGRA